MTSAGFGAVVKYGLPGLLVGLALAGAFGVGRAPQAMAQAPRPIADSSGTLAFTSSGPGTSQFLYLIDTRTQAFAVYRVDPTNPKGIVKLEAARQYRSDLRLAEYNNLPPEVAAIEAMVKSSR